MTAKRCYSEEERRKEARKYLHKIEATDNRIKEMIQEINALQDKALFIPNAKTDDVKVKGSQPHEARYENYIVKKIEIERKMDEELAHLVDIKMQVRDTISQVSDDRCQLILNWHFYRGAPPRPAAHASLSPSKPLQPHINAARQAAQRRKAKVCARKNYLLVLIARSISRLASRAAASARLSYSFLPTASASSIFTSPCLKYSLSGTSA